MVLVEPNNDLTGGVNDFRGRIEQPIPQPFRFPITLIQVSRGIANVLTSGYAHLRGVSLAAFVPGLDRPTVCR